MTVLFKYNQQRMFAGVLKFPSVFNFGNIPVNELIDADMEPFFYLPSNYNFIFFRYVWQVNVLVNDFETNPLYKLYSGYPTKKRLGGYNLRKGNASVHDGFINYEHTSLPISACIQSTPSSGDDVLARADNQSIDSVIVPLTFTDLNANFWNLYRDLYANNFSYDIEEGGSWDIAINYLATYSVFNRQNPDTGDPYSSAAIINL